MRTRLLIALAALSAAPATRALAADAVRTPFGQLADGAAVEAVQLSNGRGMKVRLISYGATVQSIMVPDRHGQWDDVVLGYPTLDGYVDKPQYFGVTVGRFANRIAGASFVLDGRRYALASNDGSSSLHGGVKGFDKQVWTIADVRSGPVASVTFTRTSPDGEEGYPGTLTTSVTYTLDERNALTTTFTATTDKPTVVNLTNHSLFNLAGVAHGHDAMGALLTVAADAYLPVDSRLIPTGELRPVAGTPFDFRTARRIGERLRDARDPQILIGRGYDHNFVLRGGVTREPRFAARLEDPATGRTMELWTTEPGVQVYTGNFLDGTVPGAGQTLYRQGDAIALEPQRFPDSPNQAAFPSARLDAGQTYRHVSVFRFGLKPR